MKILFKNIYAFALVALLTSCAYSFPLPKNGFGRIVTATSEGVSGNSIKSDKSGKACTFGVLGLVTFGDASIRDAKMDGRISEVTSVDREIYGILGIISTSCTKVYGI